VMCLWVLASVAWSEDPLLTLRRAFALAGTSMVGLYLGMKFEPKQQLKMIAIVIGLGAIASLAVALVFPDTGIVDGSWQGVYHLKNTLGRMMAMGLLSFALLATSERRYRWYLVAMFCLCFSLLLLSRSITAVVVCFLMFVLLPFRKLLFLRTRQLILAFPVVLAMMSAVAIWTVVHMEDILKLLGRTSSLTGRIPLWQYVAKEIAAKPIQGWGFMAFWNSWEGERVSSAANWDVAVPNAHNGFLEVWLGIGLIGLVILVVGLVRYLSAALRMARNNRDIDRSWPLLLLIFTVLYNLTETSLLGVNSLMWMAYVASSFWLVRTTCEERHDLQHEAELEPVLSA
jgi:exopolysaccharide production protein ExoQ